MADTNLKVMFKRGTQEALADYISGNGTVVATEGTFYLTTDTNRLYVGKGGKAVPVNQGVIGVDELPSDANEIEVGQFYYIKGQNILAINSGKKWVQINPDTDTSISDRVISITASGDNGVKVSDSIELEDNHGTDKGVKTSEFIIAGDNGVKVSVDDNNNIVISQEDYAFTSEYKADSSTAKIKLGNGSASSEFAVKAGDNVTLALDAANNQITVNANDTILRDVSLTKTNGTLKVSVSDTSNKIVHSEEVTFGIKYGNNEGNRTDATFDANGNFLIDAYTISEINDKFRDLNAMTYRGTATGIPTGTHKLGDTYKATQNFSFQQAADNGEFVTVSVKIGDLLIANIKSGEKESVDASTGEDYIDSQFLVWDIIPSGDDSLTDTTYIAKNIEHGFELANSVGLQSNGGLALKSNDYLTLTDEVKDVANTDGKLNTVTIAHKEVFDAVGATDATNAKQTEGEKLTFNIPVLGYDKAGHITSVTTKSVEVVDTIHRYNLDDFSVNVSNNKATIGTVLASALAGVNDNKAFSITSSTLALSGSGTDLTMDLEWGSF